MAFPGVRAAMQAIGGGNITEQEAFNREQIRLTRARSASADMDFKVSRAVNEGLQTDRDSIETAALRALQALYGPNLNEFQSATLGNRGTELNASKSAFGKEQANIARQIGLDALLEGDPLNATAQNAVNAVAGDKLLGPTNVLVGEQAKADLNYTNALNNAAVSRSNASDRTNMDTIVPGTVLNEILYEDGPDGSIADWLNWQAEKALTNPKIKSDYKALREYINERRNGQSIDALGERASIDYSKYETPQDVPGYSGLSKDDQNKVIAYYANLNGN